MNLKHLPALLIAFFLVLLFMACSRQEPPGAEPVQKIRIRAPDRIDRPVFVSASGTVEANETSHVAFQVAGQAVRIFAEEGSLVKAGQLLAELDPRDYDFRLGAATAQAEAARASVEKANSAVRPQELAQAKIDFERVEDEYNRHKALFERKSLAPADFKKIEAAYLVSKERYSLAQEGARQEDREAARLAYTAAKAQADLARKMLSDTKLTSPITGLVARRELETGDSVGAGRPVFIVMDLNPAKVRVGVPEAEVAKIRQGQKASITVPSFGEQTFEGRVETVGYAADPASRTYSVKVSVLNPKLILRAGMIAEARIQTDGLLRAMTVPAQAIIRDPQGATLVYIYFPDKKRVYSRRISPGALFNREIEINQGLTGSELVVVAGQNQLMEGTLVNVEEGAQ